MQQSLTDFLQASRLTVVEVNAEAGKVRVRDTADMCSDLTCHETLVVTDDEQKADLGLLNPGDIIKVEGQDGRAQKIVVLRRAWDEIASPEV